MARHRVRTFLYRCDGLHPRGGRCGVELRVEVVGRAEDPDVYATRRGWQLHPDGSWYCGMPHV
jgi:hypothetical protein